MQIDAFNNIKHGFIQLVKIEMLIYDFVAILIEPNFFAYQKSIRFVDIIYRYIRNTHIHTLSTIMQMTSTKKFCDLLRVRSLENKKSAELLYWNGLYGQVISVMRQELDSLVRCVYLLNISDLNQRERLINQTLNGERWRDIKNRIITDSEMVQLADQLNGWTRSVYKFGCAFIHLSNLHNYTKEDPFNSISKEEKEDIIRHINYYHGPRKIYELNFESFQPYFRKVFEKIHSNLKCYIDEVEEEKV